MRRSITIAVIIAAAAITTAWSVSTSGPKVDMRLGGGSAVPMHRFVLWCPAGFLLRQMALSGTLLAPFQARRSGRVGVVDTPGSAPHKPGLPAATCVREDVRSTAGECP